MTVFGVSEERIETEAGPCGMTTKSKGKTATPAKQSNCHGD
jgi:hypothetical protein